MKQTAHFYSTLFIDIGGVLLTNGWDRHSREEAISLFHLDKEETNSRHAMAFDMYEQGKIDLDAYLDMVVFYKIRPFSREDFKDFMFAQSKPLPKMLEFIHDIKTRFSLKVFTISNEGRELMLYRINTFKLKEVIDCFICSAFVHLRKPDPSIYQLALDLSQAKPEHSLYIDDRQIFVEVAETFGIKGIHHIGYESTEKALRKLLI